MATHITGNVMYIVSVSACGRYTAVTCHILTSVSQKWHQLLSARYIHTDVNVLEFWFWLYEENKMFWRCLVFSLFSLLSFFHFAFHRETDGFPKSIWATVSRNILPNQVFHVSLKTTENRKQCMHATVKSHQNHFEFFIKSMLYGMTEFEARDTSMLPELDCECNETLLGC